MIETVTIQQNCIDTLCTMHLMTADMNFDETLCCKTLFDYILLFTYSGHYFPLPFRLISAFFLQFHLLFGIIPELCSQ